MSKLPSLRMVCQMPLYLTTVDNSCRSNSNALLTRCVSLNYGLARDKRSSHGDAPPNHARSQNESHHKLSVGGHVTKGSFHIPYLTTFENEDHARSLRDYNHL